MDLGDRLGGGARLEVMGAAMEIVAPGEVAADGVGQRRPGHLHPLGVTHRPTLGIDGVFRVGGDHVDRGLDRSPGLPPRGGIDGLSLRLGHRPDELVVVGFVLEDPPAGIDLERGGAGREPSCEPQRRLPGAVFVVGHLAEEHRGDCRAHEEHRERPDGELRDGAMAACPAGEAAEERLTERADRIVGEVGVDVVGQVERGFVAVDRIAGARPHADRLDGARHAPLDARRRGERAGEHLFADRRHVAVVGG